MEHRDHDAPPHDGSRERTGGGPGARGAPLRTLLVAGAVVLALYFARSVVIPAVFALVLAVLVQPVAAWLSRRMPRWLSLTIVLLGMAVLLSSAGYLFVTGISSIVAKAPQYAGRFKDTLDNLLAFARNHGVTISADTLNIEEHLARAIQFVGAGLTSVLGALGAILLVLVLMGFGLVEADEFLPRLRRAFGAKRASRALDLVGPLTSSLQRYLLAKTALSFATAALTYLACLVLGIDFAFVWGALTFIFDYVPYVGPVLAAAPPTLMALVQYQGPGRALGILAAIVGIQFATSYIAEPRIMGRALRLSPLFVLVSVMFWGWFWGASGVVLAVPLSAALVAACSRVDRLRSLTTLLGALPDGGSGDKQKA